jgi:hypothetical protein
MDIVVLILLIAAAVCFGLALFNVPTRLNMIGGGLLAWVLATLVPLLAAL